MPDFSPVILFNLILNFVVILVLLNRFPNFLGSFFPDREQK